MATGKYKILKVDAIKQKPDMVEYLSNNPVLIFDGYTNITEDKIDSIPSTILNNVKGISSKAAVQIIKDAAKINSIFKEKVFKQTTDNTKKSLNSSKSILITFVYGLHSYAIIENIKGTPSMPNNNGPFAPLFDWTKTFLNTSDNTHQKAVVNLFNFAANSYKQQNSTEIKLDIQQIKNIFENHSKCLETLSTYLNPPSAPESN